MNAGELAVAKGIKGVRREERDDGGEKRGVAGRTEAGKRDAGEEEIPSFAVTYIKLHIFN